MGITTAMGDIGVSIWVVKRTWILDVDENLLPGFVHCQNFFERMYDNTNISVFSEGSAHLISKLSKNIQTGGCGSAF